MPPTDPETSKKVPEVGAQLRNWSRSKGRGCAVRSDGGFFLPGGARRSPDAAWFASDDRRAAARQEGKRFPSFAPDFVIEVHSPGQRTRPLREKMDECMANRVQPGWLIDRVERTITIYRHGPGTAHEPEILFNPPSVRGEGPVEGFVPDTTDVPR